MKRFSSLRPLPFVSLTLVLMVLLSDHLTTAGAQGPDNALDAADGNPQAAVYVDDGGNVGIGTLAPAARLQVRGSGDSTGVLVSHSDVLPGGGISTAELKLRASRLRVDLFGRGPTVGSASLKVSVDDRNSSRNFTLAAVDPNMPITFETNGTERIRIAPNGKIGIGTTNPRNQVHISGPSNQAIDISSTDPQGSYTRLMAVTSNNKTESQLQFRGQFSLVAPLGEEAGNRALLTVLEDGDAIFRRDMFVELPSGRRNVEIRGLFSGSGTGAWMALNEDGQERITLAAQNAATRAGGLIEVKNRYREPTIRLIGDNGDESGRIVTSSLEITGGSDLAEPFVVSGPDIKAGLVVVIDPETPGQLKLSTQAYDRKVAGIISGAGRIDPGMVMGKKDAAADGSQYVTLTGRVYAWADASNSAIQPGDLLTTSDIPGHAMKVTDHARAQGAILGKAMSSLEEGRGLVLVLVSLQ